VGYDALAGRGREPAVQIGIAVELQDRLGDLIYRARLHQEKMTAVLAEFADCGEIAGDHRGSRRHALQDLERAAALFQIAIVD
jgi:hypothetical protein